MSFLNPKPFEASFNRCGRRHGIPGWLMMGMSKQAAQFKTNAVSPRGAIGLLQVMPNVAEGYGVDPSALYDPETNVCLAAQLLRVHKDRIRQRYGVSGSNLWHFVMAANNAGWSRVKPLIDGLGPRPTWKRYAAAYSGPVSEAHIEAMWSYATQYRAESYVAYALMGLALALLGGVAYAGARSLTS